MIAYLYIAVRIHLIVMTYPISQTSRSPSVLSLEQSTVEASKSLQIYHQKSLSVTVDVTPQVSIKGDLKEKEKGGEATGSIKPGDEEIAQYRVSPIEPSCSNNSANVGAELSLSSTLDAGDGQQVQLGDHCTNKVIEEIRVKGFSSSKFERISKGTFGVVYRFADESAECAVKTVAYGVKDEDSFKEECFNALQHEVRMMKQLDHPSLVQLYGDFIYNKSPVLVMPLAEKDLELFLKEDYAGISVPVTKIQSLLYDVVQGIDYLHNEKHMIFRDLKLENIILFGDKAKICDFGTLVHFHENKIAKEVGTACYFSPEVYYKGKFSVKSDHWACGIIILELAAHPMKIKYFADNIKGIVRAFYLTRGDYTDALLSSKVGERTTCCGLMTQSITLQDQVYRYCGNPSKLVKDRKLNMDRLNRMPGSHDRLMLIATILLKGWLDWNSLVDYLKSGNMATSV